MSINLQRFFIYSIFVIMISFIISACSSSSGNITIKFNSIEISSGSTLRLPSAADIGQTTEGTFTIENNGAGVLKLDSAEAIGISGDDSDKFSLTQEPEVTIASGESTTFKISCTPSSIGTASITVTVKSNDADEADFIFTLTGATLYQWVKVIGSTGDENSYSVATDTGGNIFITGTFAGAVDFDPTTGADAHTSNDSSNDLFLTKFNADASYGWTKTMGTKDSEAGHSVATDSEGNIFLTGVYYSSLFDIIFAKYNSDSSTGYSEQVGSAAHDYGNSVAVDSSGNVYFAGSFAGADVDFDFSTGTDLHTTVGSQDIFITKINADGSYGWTKTIGSSTWDQAIAIAIDSEDSILLTGLFHEADVDFDPGTGTANLSSLGGDEIFVLKLDSNGNYLWAHAFGSTDGDQGNDIATDSENNVYITGYFAGTVDFDPDTTGTANKTADSGSYDIFLLKLDSDGNYVWVQTFGSSDDDSGASIGIDSSDNIFFAGAFSRSVDFDFGSSADIHASNDSSIDIFITKINSDGSYGWTKTIGGIDTDTVTGLALDTSDNLFLTGYFVDDVDFNFGTGTDNYTASGKDIFLLKFVP